MFRVGIWLDYGDLLDQNTGHGVLTYELVRGFLSLDETVRVTLLARPGDREKVIHFAGGAHPLLEVATRAQDEKHVPFHQARECDVWLFPYLPSVAVGNVPSVLWVHDDVGARLSAEADRPSADIVDSEEPPLSKLFPSATSCICSSRNVQNDVLVDKLGISPAKVRHVRLAVPSDLAQAGLGGGTRLPLGSERPYLFWPAAFRQHKNHMGLLTALRVLRDQYAEAQFDIVFTGDTRGELPQPLRRVVDDSGLAANVRALGAVPRDTLSALYRHAFATLVCSTSDQGPLPIYEGLRSGSPVACSSIPSLREHCGEFQGAMVYFDPLDPDAIARAILQVRDDRAVIVARQQAASEPILARTWKDVAREMLDFCKEAAAIATLPRVEQISRCARPWPEEPIPIPAVSGPPEVFLFLPVVYPGGVWQATKDLLFDLIAINRQSQELSLTFALPDDEGDVEVLRFLRQHLTVARFELSAVSRQEATRLLGDSGMESHLPGDFYSFVKGCARQALQADAWFALADRFRLPLLPARPYGVLVYDVIQRHAPETFPTRFFEWMERGMTPTLRRAEVVLTTSESTRKDVVEGFGVEPSRVRMVPISSAPSRRFGRLVAEHVGLPREPFLLQVTNIAPHKGVKVMLRGYARLKQRLGEETPLLVVCGYGTERLAPSRQDRADDPTLRDVRKLIREVGLRETHDVVFLGFVRDTQLLDLYQRTAVVVNAARYDNGSLCAIEGRYFGKPVVSSEYAAASEMCGRFRLPVHFFPVEDDNALAEKLAVALKEGPATGDELARARQALDQPQFTHRHYAEQVYRVLAELAWRGRNQRLGIQPA